MAYKYSDRYKQDIVDQVVSGEKSIDAVSKENHHSWRTIEKWLKEYGAMEPEDTGQVSAENENKYSAAYGGSHERFTGFDVDKYIPYEISASPVPCLECIRLQAKLDVYQSILERFLGGI